VESCVKKEPNTGRGKIREEDVTISIPHGLGPVSLVGLVFGILTNCVSALIIPLSKPKLKRSKWSDGPLASWVTGWLGRWLGWLAVWLAGCLVGCLVPRLASWWPAGWLFGRLAGWRILSKCWWVGGVGGRIGKLRTNTNNSNSVWEVSQKEPNAPEGENVFEPKTPEGKNVF
jgi:hypothetical protein